MDILSENQPRSVQRREQSVIVCILYENILYQPDAREGVEPRTPAFSMRSRIQLHLLLGPISGERGLEPSRAPA